MEGDAQTEVAGEGTRAPEAWAPFDAAIRAYLGGTEDAFVVVRTDVADDDAFPVALLFREEAALDGIDRTALAAAAGRILDVGAGVGALAVPLAARGLDVTALEVLPSAVEVLRSRGVRDVRQGGPERLAPDERFDTVLLLMNGAGLAGSRAALPAFLATLAGGLAPGGTILVDSTDPRGWEAPDDGRAPGEVHMQLVFGGVAGAPFPLLYIDAEALFEAAGSVGLAGRVVMEAEGGRFLAALTAPL